MLSNKHKLRTTIKEYILITIGLSIYAFGFTTLIVPSNTVPGGAGGISTIIYYALGQPDSWLYSIGNIYLVVNIILLAIGFLVIGPKFGTKTLYGIGVITIFMNIFAQVIPEGVLGLSATGGDQLLMVILGGVMCGIGVGLCFMQGGSTGGTDIIAMMVNKFRNVSFGKVIMACDFIIITSSVVILGGDLKPAIYGFVMLATVGYTIDMVVSGGKQSSQITIYSNQYQEIGQRIISEAKRGVTYINGEGGFSGKEIKIVSVVCRRAELSGIYRIIKEVDPNAFITSAAVSGAYGLGFDALKVKGASKN